jgi:L-lactate utilization protein LutC
MPPELAHDPGTLSARADAVRAVMTDRADSLLSELEEWAVKIGWRVARASTREEAVEYILSLSRNLEARTAVRTAHPVLQKLDLERAFAGTGTELELMAADAGPDEGERRNRMIAADLGITGADYAVAETGTCVLLARKGVSRLVSLLPPVHVAVVERGQVLPSLDELFTLRWEEYLSGELASYVNLISGPSRSADIEYTLVTGVHGPGQVHMVLIG